MTPDQAATLFAFVQPQIVDESKTTRKVLAAVPAETCSYSPDSTSMNGLKLAGHIATAEKFFLDGILEGKFDETASDGEPNFQTPAEVVAFYDEQVLPLHTKLAELPAEKLAQIIPVFGMELPAIVLLNIKLKHSIHHRGQLCAYLRPMGAKVPSIYGGSADEPMGAAQGA